MLKPAQKIKNKLFWVNLLCFCAEVRRNQSTILHSDFSPTKMVGYRRSCFVWIQKVNIETEVSPQNQVTFCVNFCILCRNFLFIFYISYLLNIVCFCFCFLTPHNKSKKVTFNSVFTSGLAFLGGIRLLTSLVRRSAWKCVLDTHKTFVCWQPVRKWWCGIYA